MNQIHRLRKKKIALLDEVDTSLFIGKVSKADSMECL